MARYVSCSLQEKKLLYFGVENLDFSFIDPVSTKATYIKFWCRWGTQRTVSSKSYNCFPCRIFGLQKMLYLNHWGRRGGKSGRMNKYLSFNNFMLCQLSIFCVLLSGLKKRKWLKKWKWENSRRKWMTVAFLQVSPTFCFSFQFKMYRLSFLSLHICPLRWFSPSGRCDHHHGRWGFERDQPCSAWWSHDREGVWQNTAVSNSKFGLLKSLALSDRDWNALTNHFLLSLIGCGISWRWLPRTTVSTHTSWDIWGPDCASGCKGGWTWQNANRLQN